MAPPTDCLLLELAFSNFSFPPNLRISPSTQTQTQTQTQDFNKRSRVNCHRIRDESSKPESIVTQPSSRPQPFSRGSVPIDGLQWTLFRLGSDTGSNESNHLPYPSETMQRPAGKPARKSRKQQIKTQQMRYRNIKVHPKAKYAGTLYSSSLMTDIRPAQIRYTYIMQSW
ncbi:hypothetical protein M747DRAFT_331531 [Aspergillus niger ATCC 13496]|uniref:Uncharacterized protein n=1 Tax=Aspergillus niger ATCC 13496 TaxID=1353008 RepID=A0A370C0S9_ASPNG|nr:hypothetical protein M747DRAFT_331531 [Aspergillus niger ATCC 13496]